METGKGSKGTTPPLSLKRKPLLDTTNLIPPTATATIFRKLSSTLSDKPRFLSPIREEFPKSGSDLTPQLSNVSASKSRCDSSVSNTGIRACNFRTASRIPIPMLTGKGDKAIYDPLVVYSRKGNVEINDNKAGGGVNVNDAKVARTRNLKKGGKDKGKAEILSDICLNLEKSNRHKSRNAEILDLKTVDVPILENVNTKRKAISQSRSNKFRGNVDTFEGTVPVKSKCKKLQEEKDLFFEQQRSYFKEVDEFELMVEEASVGDSD